MQHNEPVSMCVLVGELGVLMSDSVHTPATAHMRWGCDGYCALCGNDQGGWARCIHKCLGGPRLPREAHAPNNGPAMRAPWTDAGCDPDRPRPCFGAASANFRPVPTECGPSWAKLRPTAGKIKTLSTPRGR